MIVFDASTMILLSKIDILEKFVFSYQGKILAPEKVIEEVFAEGREEISITKLVKYERIKVLKVNNQILIKKLMEDFSIDRGESEALVLALQEKASLVATDDGNAIKACKMLKIPFTTAIAVLVRSYEKGLVDQDTAAVKLEKLESIARYSRKIIEDARSRIVGKG